MSKSRLQIPFLARLAALRQGRATDAADAAPPPAVEAVVQEGTRNHRRVRATLYGVLVALCANFFLQTWQAHQTERSRRHENEATELAAAQRWLSQRIARLALSPQVLAAEARGDELLATLAQSDTQTQQLQELLTTLGLLTGDARTEAGRAWEAWVRSRAAMTSSARSLLEDAARSPPAATAALATRVGTRADEALQRVQVLLDLMHAHAARSHAERARQLQWWGVLNIGLLSLLALVAVEPAVRSMRRQYRRLAAQALDLQRLALVAEHTSNAVLLIDAQGKVTWTNPAYTRITGRAAASVVGVDAHAALLSAAADDVVAAQLQRALTPAPASAPGHAPGHAAGHTGQRLQLHYRRADASDCWLDVDLQPLHDEAGVARGQVVVAVDVTAFHHAQAELRIAAIAFDSMGGIAVTDGQVRLLRANPAFTQITGFSLAEAQERTLIELLGSNRHDSAFYTAMQETLAREQHWQGEYWSRRKDGEIYPQWLSISDVRDDHGQTTNYVIVFTDITEKKRADDSIRSLAFYDPLTKLPNRRLLHERIEATISASARTGRHAALLFIDLDKFKQLNDTHGHEAGDQLLCAVATRLTAGVRSDDTVARQGGDEFVVLVNGLSHDAAEARTQAGRLAETMRRELNRPFVLDGLRHQTSPSIGVNVFSGAAHGIDELLERADSAMYLAKHAGRNAYRFFDPQLHAEREERAQLAADLQQALVQQQLELHLQPQVDALGSVIGAEALLRWPHPTRGQVAPDVFIALAEESDLIVDIDTWVLQAAGELLARWGEEPRLAELSLAINVSARQFRQAGFGEQVRALAERIGRHAQRLKLELSQSLVVDGADAADSVLAIMRSLRAQGVQLALEDFGTGQAPLATLTRLPLNELKIAASLVHGLPHSPADTAAVQTLIALAVSLGIGIVAEGVERTEQRQRLLALGCPVQQGHLFAGPMPRREFEARVRRS